MTRHLLTLADYSREEVRELLRLAAEIKARPQDFRDTLRDQALGMIFLKASTRTRVSFEVGIHQLGGYASLVGAESQLGRGEPLADTARALSGYVDLLMARLATHQQIEELAAHASVPVINGLTDLYHPCQALADLLTIQECLGGCEGVPITYVGDPNNVAHSLLLGAAHLGAHLTVAAPEGYEVDGRVWQQALAIAEGSGSRVRRMRDPFAAVADARVVYTDVWTSMGHEAERAQRLRDFADYGVDQRLMAASDGAIFLHCLPCHRGEEVAAEVVDGADSRVWQQAENRLHVQKAAMVFVSRSR
jgi:ornithine carbamoyltransferase